MQQGGGKKKQNVTLPYQSNLQSDSSRDPITTARWPFEGPLRVCTEESRDSRREAVKEKKNLRFNHARRIHITRKASHER